MFWRQRSRSEVEVRKQVALTLCNRSGTLGKLGRPMEAIEPCDLLVARFSGEQDPAIRNAFDVAANNRRLSLLWLGRSD